MTNYKKLSFAMGIGLAQISRISQIFLRGFLDRPERSELDGVSSGEWA